jgi:hypothetical protein
MCCFMERENFILLQTALINDIILLLILGFHGGKLGCYTVWLLGNVVSVSELQVKMETICSSETSGVLRNTRRYNPARLQAFFSMIFYFILLLVGRY